jgi:uncharacterized membrane protein
MSLYELLLFCHIVSMMLWIGSSSLLNLMAYRYERGSDVQGLHRIAREAGELAKILFIPSSIATLIFGILLTIDGPWSFGALWIVLGLAGIAATIFTGLLILTPRTEEIDRLLDSEGMTPRVATKITEMLTLARIDLVVLYLVIADMAIKPTGDDVGVLIGMAVIVIAAALFFGSRARAIAAGQPDAPPGREPSVTTQAQP